jgi:acetoacetyl-CoA synthetase
LLCWKLKVHSGYALRVLMQTLIEKAGCQNFRELHSWSVANPGLFWAQAWQDLGIVGDSGAIDFSGSGFADTKWFPKAKLNVVNTLLAGDPNKEVLVAYSEAGPRVSLSRGELKLEVAACAAALKASGVKQNDRVAAWMTNSVESVIFALGALSIGAVVSTASTDFGPAALVDRFGQIEPVLLLSASTYSYGGKHHSLLNKLDEVDSQLPTVKTLIVVGANGPGQSFEAWLAPHRGSEFAPELFGFDQPGFILFSSGTTGKPKCIIHSAAGVLLKVLSEQGYHMDINQSDRVLYSTTCGWMMWNWLVFGLGRGATIVLVDGSPGYPNVERLWQITNDEKLSFLGVSAALIDVWRQQGLNPKDKYQLGSLRTIASTGSPLAASGFDWVEESVGSHVSVVSIAGGTDLCGCLVLGVPTEKVPRGEIQGPALGLDVVVLRADGSEADSLEDGELVCRTPFPTVPLGFWGDNDRAKIHSAYFDRFEGIWAHGDHARRTATGGFEILGRLDATLNSKGVRIGTAEIYRVVLTIAGITGALAVAQPSGNDTRVVLFVVCEGELTEELAQEIRSTLRSQASPRHVPDVIAKAPDLPRTRNGKLNELAVSDIVSSKPERDSSTLANPESLEFFRTWTKQNPAS